MNTANKPIPIYGSLSLVLSPLGLLLVIYFALAGGWGITHTRAVITFAQYSLLFLLGTGLTLSIAGIVNREQPQWLLVSGLIVTLSIIVSIGLYFYSLDD